MKRLVLIDGHSILFRAFHAFPPLTTSKGELVNAVYGFTSILLSVIRDLEPTHLAVTFDRAAPTFRHKEYAGYKAHRPETPEELVSQQGRVEEIISALRIPIFALDGYEADDIIGTLALQAKSLKVKSPFDSAQGEQKFPPGQRPSRVGDKVKSTAQKSKLKAKESEVEVVIVTGDRDALQLVDEPSTLRPFDYAQGGLRSGRASLRAGHSIRSGRGRVMVYMPARGKRQARLWDMEAVGEYYGLTPSQLVDLKALAGDASDEIPGVKGIGPKTAAALLQKYESLQGIYAHLGKVKEEFGPVVHQKLTGGKESAYLSRQLAAITLNVPVKLSWKECALHDYDKAKAINTFRDLEFDSLIPKLPNDSYEQMVQEEMFSNK